MSRFNLLLLLVFVGLFGALSLQADTSDERLQVEQDLFQVGKFASQSQQPVLILFAADHCEYCERLEADYLGPMSSNEEYTGKVIIRKVLIDSYYSIRDFNGKMISGDKLASQYGVRVTPTVIVFNDQGEALGKKLIGYNGSQYYGWDLDKAIDAALVRMKKS